MITSGIIFSIALCLFYGVVVLCYARLFFRSAACKPVATRVWLIAAILLHLGHLSMLVVRPHGSLLQTPAGALSALAFALAFSYFLIEWITRERNMGLCILPLSLLFQIISAARIGFESPVGKLPDSPLLPIHVVTALVGYCAFSLSAAFSGMYLMQYRELKIHRLGLIFERLPALDKLENMGYRAVHFGLGFLLVGVVLGEILLYRQEGHLVLADTKIAVAVLSIVLYGLIIAMRTPLAIRGKRFAQLSILGFVLILFSLLVVDNFFSKLHQFSL